MVHKKIVQNKIVEAIRVHHQEGEHYSEDDIAMQIVTIRKKIESEIELDIEEIDQIILRHVHKVPKKNRYHFNPEQKTRLTHDRIMSKIRDEDTIPNSSDEQISDDLLDDEFEKEFGVSASSKISKPKFEPYQYQQRTVPKPKMRTTESNGPYGTQWLHDPQFHDELTEEIENRAKHFDKLRAVIVPEQRTKPWFEMRETCISASDGALVVNMNPYEPQYKIIFKKATPDIMPFESNIHCYHGKKLEEIATMIYEYRMGVKVEEFGLMKHPKISFLGASPDGIVGRYKLDGKHRTKFVGRMLEIKCPAVRKINQDGPQVIYKKDAHGGICPTYYWIQVQLQLECCDLEECDFWQCNIKEYQTREEFIKDTDPAEPFRSLETGFEKGCLIQLIPKDKVAKSLNCSDDYDHVIWDDASFIYPPKIEMTPEECDSWVSTELANLHMHPKYRKYVLDRVIYWKLIESKNITIPRDQEWFQENYPMYEKIWSYVSYLREHPEIAKLAVKFVNSLEPLTEKIYRKTKKDKEEGEKNNAIIMDTIDKLCHPERPGYDAFFKGLLVELENAEIVNFSDHELDDEIDSPPKTKPKKVNKSNQNETEKLGLTLNAFGSAFVD